MKKINESIIKKALYEALNEVMLDKNQSFTPYTKQDRERNFKGLTQMGNPSYEAFRKWREQELEKGRPSKELGWETYKQENKNNK